MDLYKNLKYQVSHRVESEIELNEGDGNFRLVNIIFNIL